MNVTPATASLFSDEDAAETAATHLAAERGHRLRAWLRETDHPTVRSLAACAFCDGIVEIRAWHGDRCTGLAIYSAVITDTCLAAHQRSEMN